MNSEKILVIEKNHSNKIKIKGSQFLGFSFKVTSFDDVRQNLEFLKKKYYDATHHCYAYKLKNGDEKYSDDGEPNGTAGIRILNAINHFSITDILIVFVRYFGGTKLGVGPLGKAYGEAANNLLETSSIIKLTKFEKISFTYDYEYVSSIHYLLGKYKCEDITNMFDSSPGIECCIEPRKIDQLRAEMIEKTAGKVNIKELNQQIYIRINQAKN